MSGVLHECAVDPVRAAVAGLHAAAAAATELDYAGLAAHLEDLAAVLAALPGPDARSVAHALASGTAGS
jgi:hypothetical protein